MDYKLTRENFTVQDLVLNTSAEQAVELDYVLPDYCPEIFRILSCRILPSVSGRNLSGSKLSYGLSVLIRVCYVSESGEISAVEQTLSYEKTADLPSSPKNPVLHIEPTCVSKSCRVVNKRRIDVRGAVSVRLRVSSLSEAQAVSEALGGGIQLKRSVAAYPSRRLFITKRVSVVDEVEIIGTKPPLGVVLSADAYVADPEKKVLSGKLLTKGEASVSVLYIPDGGGEPEKISFELPFSQVSDVEGLDESYDIYVDAQVVGCDIRPLPKSEPARLECELKIDITCLALKFESVKLADDVFSTECEADCDRSDCSLPCMPTAISEAHRIKSVLTYSEGEIRSVITASAEACPSLEISSAPGGGSIIRGKATVTVYARNESGRPICLEAEVPFEHSLPETVCDCGVSDIRASAGSAAYNLSGTNAIEVTAEIRLRGYICGEIRKSFISDIRLDESRPVERDKACSLKLYYAEAGESPWEIAKRCKASLAAILEENEIEGERVENGGMLLIPID